MQVVELVSGGIINIHVCSALVGGKVYKRLDFESDLGGLDILM